MHRRKEYASSTFDSGQYAEGAHAHKIVQPLSFLGGSKSCESFSICRISSLKQSTVVDAERNKRLKKRERKEEKKEGEKKSQSTATTCNTKR